VILTAAWPIEPATGPRKLSLVAGVLPKHGVVMTTVATTAGTGNPSGGAATGVTVATAMLSTPTTDHGVTQVTATVMAGLRRAAAPTHCNGAQAVSKDAPAQAGANDLSSMTLVLG
jgi:hypothetical protein